MHKLPLRSPRREEHGLPLSYGRFGPIRTDCIGRMYKRLSGRTRCGAARISLARSIKQFSRHSSAIMRAQACSEATRLTIFFPFLGGRARGSGDLIAIELARGCDQRALAFNSNRDTLPPMFAAFVGACGHCSPWRRSRTVSSSRGPCCCFFALGGPHGRQSGRKLYN